MLIRVRPATLDFPAIPVTKTLTRTVGNITVSVNLYGPVSDARLAKEQKELEYRVEQLTPIPPRPRRERTPDKFEELLDEYETFQSGGRR
jgi:hypothetical protein